MLVTISDKSIKDLDRRLFISTNILPMSYPFVVPNTTILSKVEIIAGAICMHSFNESIALAFRLRMLGWDYIWASWNFFI
jgi:hypothetical protein